MFYVFNIIIKQLGFVCILIKPSNRFLMKLNTLGIRLGQSNLVSKLNVLEYYSIFV